MRFVHVILIGVAVLSGGVQGQVPDSRSPTPEGVVTAGQQLPPTIADIVLLLQSYKPDEAKVQRLRSEVDAPEPDKGSAFDLARFWHRKAIAAEALGDVSRRHEALLKADDFAVRAGGSSPSDEIGSLKRIRQDLAGSSTQAMGYGAGVDAAERFLRQFEMIDPGAALNTRSTLVRAYLGLGNIERAMEALARSEGDAVSWGMRPGTSTYLSTWRTNIESARGQIHLARGKVDEALRSFAAAQRMSEQMIKDSELNRASGRYGQTASRAEASRDAMRLQLARALGEKQSYDESELLLRDILRTTLLRQGRNSLLTGSTLHALSLVHLGRGRYAEALTLARWADRTLEEAGINQGSPGRLNARSSVADLLVIQGRHAQAVPIYDELRRLATLNARHGAAVELTKPEAVLAYVQTGRLDDALVLADRLLTGAARNYGEAHRISAEARGYRAIVLARTGRAEEARQELARALEALLEPDHAGSGASALHVHRLRVILDSYLEILVGPGVRSSAQDVAEAFRIADVVRWQSVQKAVTGSAVRAAAGTPQLGERIKRMQDAEDELQAVYKNLISQRSAPPDKQLPAVIASMERRIAELVKEQASALGAIRKEFPRYDALVNPRPADLAAARQALRVNEAMLSIYLTEQGAYVWAVGGGPDSTLQFHYSARPRAWFVERVRRLREAVDLTSGDSPDRLRFDVESSEAIYQELLAPVKAAWRGRDTLLVVANDVLGQIPFAMLSTGPMAAAQGAAVALPLAQFRRVPWLGRELATAYVPSISALVTLRAVPASGAQRTPFVGFGDPDFRSGSANAVQLAGGTRNLKIKRAPKWDEHMEEQGAQTLPAASQTSAVPQMPELSPLPDTRNEIMAIAVALGADLKQDIFFGEAATPERVRQTDLRRRRIVAFATHGLVAGDLPGLEQPALALTPMPGKDLYSGLFKLDDVLKLSLDADLVVLSACNTAAADGNGSEAVSGLGRGFFYAGSRSVLATHWPVETVSARQLVSQLFEYYANEAGLTRAKALQRAMLEVLDKEVAKDGGGTPTVAYAHPAFWAPYALYGDPGR